MPGTLIASLRHIAANAVSILASDVVNRGSTFVLYVLVTRYLGLLHFGQLSLALTFFYIFQVLAGAGLKTYITRQVARDRSQTERYLISGSALVVVAALGSIALLVVVVRLLEYSSQTALVILLLSLGLLPYSLSTIAEALFQAWEKMQYIPYVTVPLNLLRLGAALLLLASGHGIYLLVTLLLIAHIVTAVVQWWLLLRRLPVNRSSLKLDLRFSWTVAKSTAPFLGIDGLIALMTGVNVILLSKLAGETEVGLYTAAVQLSIPVIVLYQALVVSTFPLMSRSLAPDYQTLTRIAGRLLELLLMVGLPAIVGLFFLADSMLTLVYGGQAFALGAVALRILVWELLFRAFTSALGQVLLASLRERATLGIVAIDAVVAVSLGLVLISRFGLIGAAVASVIMRLVDLLQHYLRVSGFLTDMGQFVKGTWRPGLAAACLAIYLALTDQFGLLWIVPSAAFVYAGVLLTVLIWSLGGPRQFRARYLYLRSD